MRYSCYKPISFVSLVLIIIFAHVGWANDLKSYKGSYTEIYYENEADLAKLNRRISLRWLKKMSAPRDIKDLSLPAVVTRKLDVIRKNVERILDMHPRESLISFNVLGDNQELKNVLRLKFGNDKVYRAFYSRRDKHVYVAADDVNTNIVAHETAHAVVDMELGPAVPETVHEILARYVDAHLYD